MVKFTELCWFSYGNKGSWTKLLEYFFNQKVPYRRLLESGKIEAFNAVEAGIFTYMLHVYMFLYR